MNWKDLLWILLIVSSFIVLDYKRGDDLYLMLFFIVLILVSIILVIWSLVKKLEDKKQKR
jgi:hypothetical protein